MAVRFGVGAWVGEGRSVGRVARVLPALLVVWTVGCGPDATEPDATGSSRAGLFELREVLEVAPSGTPGWDSLEVTCTGTEVTVSTGCAADREVVLLDREGTAKYRLAPAAFTAEDVSGAGVIQGDPQAVSGWMVVIQLRAAGTKAFAEFTSELVGEQVAIVLEGVVASAPTVQVPITSGSVQVGNLSESDAKALADRLSPSPSS